jgi:nitroreductase
MNDTIDLLERRRSVPPMAMTGVGPTPEDIETMLRIAARVPDHGKLAPWRFILLEGEARTRAGALVADIYAVQNREAPRERVVQESQIFSHAPLVVVVVSSATPHVKIPQWEQVLSAGAVCMNLTTAAVALGFRTAWHSGWAAYDPRVADAFGLAGHEKIAGFIHIGRSNMDPEDRARPDLAKIVTRF